MKVLISKVLYFEKYLLFWKRKKIKHDHPNFQYVVNRKTDTVVLKFVTVLLKVLLLQNILVLKSSVTAACFYGFL